MSDAEKDYSVPTGILQLIAAQTMLEVASLDPRYQSIANTLTRSIDITELLNAPSMQQLRPQANGMIFLFDKYFCSISESDLTFRIPLFNIIQPLRST